jgi:hypothetical protein
MLFVGSGSIFDKSHTSVILRDFSLEGSRAYDRNSQADCKSASPKMLRKLSMTLRVRNKPFKPSYYVFVS